MKTYIVDAFTSQKYKGNPAGVCLVEDVLTDKEMLLIAQELNFSETAFVRKTNLTTEFDIRYFSPKQEIPLCGHATLASSKVLFNTLAIENIVFRTIKNLELNITKNKDYIVMEFPIYGTSKVDVNDALLKALGLKQITNCEYNKETNILLLEIEDVDILEHLSPNYNSLIDSRSDIIGVLITAKSKNENFDFYSRFFWPWSGTNEDPVTGSTHTFLTPYWSKRLKKKKLRSFQCSNRTGSMDLEIIGTNKLLIKANAVIVFEGKLVP